MRAAAEVKVAALMRLMDVGAEVQVAALLADPTYVAEVASVIRAGCEAGAFSVFLREVGDEEAFVYGTAVARLGMSPDLAADLALRVEHVAPQEVISGVAIADAVAIKDHFACVGLRAEVKEGRVAPFFGHREAVPERVRNEVWRRDGGSCVDCGSRTRLEFDHIIPLSKGGSNTARNLELRCEECNRSKAANI